MFQSVKRFRVRIQKSNYFKNFDSTYLLFVFIALLLLEMGYLLGMKSNFLTTFKNEVVKNYAKSENSVLLSDLSKIIHLPDNETPLIATVNDVEKLKSGSSAQFFQNSQKGDKVIIYSKSKKIILYRPNSHRIINISSLESGFVN